VVGLVPFAASVAPAVGTAAVIGPANVVIGLDSMLGTTFRSFLLGSAFLHTAAMSRFVGVLPVIVFPMTLLAGL
jgi:hypothetical protein